MSNVIQLVSGRNRIQVLTQKVVVFFTAQYLLLQFSKLQAVVKLSQYLCVPKTFTP